MADLMPEPWHLAIRGRVLDVHCGATEPNQTRVTSRWLASCPACLAATEPPPCARPIEPTTDEPTEP